MRTIIALTFSVMAFYLFTNKNQQLIKNDAMKTEHGKPQIDTILLVKKTDSIAANELKKHDEQSLQKTGVPISMVHFDKIFITDKINKIFTVSYNFNQQKFYGKNWKQIEIPNSNKFPYHFSVIYDLTTQKTTVVKGEL